MSTIIAIKAIADAEDNLREQLDIDDGFVSSIRTFGILTPLRVEKHGKTDDGKQAYRIQAGHRRKYGAIEAGLDTVPCDVVAKADDDDRTAVMLIENLQRADINPVDEFVGFQRLVAEHQWTAERVAEVVGLTPATVKKRLKWAKLPDVALAAVREGRWRIADADACANASAKNIAAVSNDGAKLPDLYELSNIARKETRAREIRKQRKTYAQRGAIVVDPAEWKALAAGESENLEAQTIVAGMDKPTKSNVWVLTNDQDLTGFIIVCDATAQWDNFKVVTDGAAHGHGSQKSESDMTDWDRAVAKFREDDDQQRQQVRDAERNWRIDVLNGSAKEKLAAFLEIAINELYSYDLEGINRLLDEPFETVEELQTWARKSASNRVDVLLRKSLRNYTPDSIGEEFPRIPYPDRDWFHPDGSARTEAEYAEAMNASDDVDDPVEDNDEAEAESASDES